MVSLATPTKNRTIVGSYVLHEGDDITFDGLPLFIEDAAGEEITFLVDAPTVTIVTRQSEGAVAIHPRFGYTWHVGETASPFAITVRHQDGTARTDIAFATFTLTNRVTGTKLIDAQSCQIVADGVLSYRPTALEMATACLFLAQYRATLATGEVLPTLQVEGEIEANL